MNRYYLETIPEGNEPSLIIRLDAVESLTEVFSGRVSSEPMADKNTVSDTYINQPRIFTMQGVVSGVVQPGETTGKDIKVFTSNLKTTITRGTLLNFISADEVYPYCVIEECQFTKTVREGIEGWKVNLSIKQLNLVEALQISIDEAPLEEISDDAADKNSINSNTSKDITDVNTQVEELGAGALDSLPPVLLQNITGNTGGGG